MDKAQFLLECSTMIAPMWVGVKPGSIVFDCGRRNTGDPRRCSDHDDISGTEPAKFRQHPENPNSRAHLQPSTSPTTASPPSAKGIYRPEYKFPRETLICSPMLSPTAPQCVLVENVFNGSRHLVRCQRHEALVCSWIPSLTALPSTFVNGVQNGGNH